MMKKFIFIQVDSELVILFYGELTRISVFILWYNYPVWQYPVSIHTIETYCASKIFNVKRMTNDYHFHGKGNKF